LIFSPLIKKRNSTKGWTKTRETFSSKLGKAVAGKSVVDADVLDNLEEVLVTSDVGVTTTLRIIERIEERVAKDKYLGTEDLNRILRKMRSKLCWLKIPSTIFQKLWY
jgi:fused signal recognition particle receptor